MLQTSFLCRDSCDIAATSMPYIFYRTKRSEEKVKDVLWPEELDNEMRSLYEEYLSFEEKPEGHPVIIGDIYQKSICVISEYVAGKVHEKIVHSFFFLIHCCLGVDIVEYIEQGLSRTRTRKQIIREMKSMGLHTFGLKASKRFLV